MEAKVRDCRESAEFPRETHEFGQHEVVAEPRLDRIWLKTSLHDGVTPARPVAPRPVGFLDPCFVKELILARRAPTLLLGDPTNFGEDLILSVVHAVNLSSF
jgi:hypothetical protein